jgi:hypothetical protein
MKKPDEGNDFGGIFAALRIKMAAEGQSEAEVKPEQLRAALDSADLAADAAQKERASKDIESGAAAPAGTQSIKALEGKPAPAAFEGPERTFGGDATGKGFNALFGGIGRAKTSKSDQGTGE